MKMIPKQMKNGYRVTGNWQEENKKELFLPFLIIRKHKLSRKWNEIFKHSKIRFTNYTI